MMFPSTGQTVTQLRLESEGLFQTLVLNNVAPSMPCQGDRCKTDIYIFINPIFPWGPPKL